MADVLLGAGVAAAVILARIWVPRLWSAIKLMDERGWDGRGE